MTASRRGPRDQRRDHRRPAALRPPVGGDEAVAGSSPGPGRRRHADELEDQSRSWSYDTRIRLFAAATEVLGDPRTMYEVAPRRCGRHGALPRPPAAHHGLARQVFGKLPRAVPEVQHDLDDGDPGDRATTATIRYRLHEGYPHSRLDCLTPRAASTVPRSSRSPGPGRPRRVPVGRPRGLPLPAGVGAPLPPAVAARPHAAVDPELHALRGQLQTLQSAATDLVASDDLETVLRRIVAARPRPSWRPPTCSPSGARRGAPLVHSAGVPEDRVPELAAALLAGDDLGSGAVVATSCPPAASTAGWRPCTARATSPWGTRPRCWPPTPATPPRRSTC